jgi:K+-transporting ATPase ATPase C chain
MWKHITIAVRFTIITMVLLGIMYPLFVTGIARVVFPRQSNGSMVVADGRVVGSELLGQTFTRPEYFHCRPSAAFDPDTSKDERAPRDNYVSGGSNLAPTSRTLKQRVHDDVQEAEGENPALRKSGVPIDMVTASASGFDPDITPANAYAQAARVAAARGISVGGLEDLIREHTRRRQLGFMGELRVNVLELNLAIDGRSAAKR